MVLIIQYWVELCWLFSCPLIPGFPHAQELNLNDVSSEVVHGMVEGVNSKVVILCDC